ncbi:MAG: WbuC family cupin fold metalloprotein [Bacteroidales bacterium]|nr:WbuC family cupin fold metalloprotein [Bacteroidales bacterium]
MTEQAKASPRLRMNLGFRNSAEDMLQRMLNAIAPGTVMPIHRHRTSSETVVCVRGISRCICMMSRVHWWRRWIWCLEAMC